MQSNTRTQAAAMLLFTALAWGAQFSVAKTALVSIDAFHLSTLRYVPAAAVMLAVLAAVEGRRALRLDGAGVKLWLYGSFGFAGFSILAFLGVAATTPEQAAIIVALMPLVTALVAWIMRGRRPALSTWAAIGVALAGVSLVITRGHLHFGAEAAWGADATVLAGVACWAVYTMGAAAMPTFSPLRYTALSMTLGAVSIVGVTVIATALGAPLPAPADVAAVWPQIAYMSIVAGVLAVLAWNAGVGTLGPSTGALFVNLVPIVAFAIAVAHGRRFGAAEVAGVLLTIAALVGGNIAARPVTQPRATVAQSMARRPGIALRACPG